MSEAGTVGGQKEINLEMRLTAVLLGSASLLLALPHCCPARPSYDLRNVILPPSILSSVSNQATRFPDEHAPALLALALVFNPPELAYLAL